jgi:hypothetical protein
MQITTDPWRKTHTIHIPKHPGPDADLERYYLEHEYAHACLAETVNPLLSTAYFVPGTPDDLVSASEYVFKTASDWFADGLLSSIFPDRFRADTADVLTLLIDNFRDKGGLPDTDYDRLSYALLLAQAAHYVIGPDAPPFVGPKIRTLRDAFIRRDPTRPSRDAMRLLLNDLLYPVNRTQVSIVQSDGVDVWGFIRL